MANLAKKKMKNTGKARSTAKPDILGFDENGKPIKAKKPMKKGPLVTFGFVATVLGTVYIPAMFPTTKPPLSYSALATVDKEMIRTGQAYFNTYPDEDFDGDGLSNALETMYKTDPYLKDTDGDGLTDYIEIYSLNTSPIQWNNKLQSYISSIDASNGNATGTPYKIGNVVLWADNLYSKTYGGVVKTPDGYEFSNFSGWAQFPDTGHAYQYIDGIHKELPYNPDSNAYHINGSGRIVFFTDSMKKYYKLDVFGDISYLENGTIGQIFDFLLPDYGNNGFFKCYPVMKCDKIGVNRQDTVLEITVPPYELKPERFAMNSTSLEDIAKVYSSINNGKTVAASLYLDNYGETLVVIYGYTSEGDLLAADLATQKPLGILSVNEKCGRTLNAEGVVELDQWFTFSCAGYSTKNHSKLVFLFDETGSYDGTPFVPASQEEDKTEEQPEETTAVTTETSAPEETVIEAETTGAPVTEEVSDISTTNDTTQPPEETSEDETDAPAETEDTSASEKDEQPAETTAETEEVQTSVPFDFTSF